MAAKGNEAKGKLINLFIKSAGKDYVGISGNKYYFNVNENGETVQIAVSLTLTKNPITVTTHTPITEGGFDFEAAENIVIPKKAFEISEEEKQTIEELMKKLGL